MSTDMISLRACTKVLLALILLSNLAKLGRCNTQSIVSFFADSDCQTYLGDITLYNNNEGACAIFEPNVYPMGARGVHFDTDCTITIYSDQCGNTSAQASPVFSECVSLSNNRKIVSLSEDTCAEAAEPESGSPSSPSFISLVATGSSTSSSSTTTTSSARLTGSSTSNPSSSPSSSPVSRAPQSSNSQADLGASTSSTSSSSINLSTASPTTSATPASTSKGLSVGSKAGIGVGVSVVGIAVVAILFKVWQRNSNSHTQSRQEQDINLNSLPTEPSSLSRPAHDSTSEIVSINSGVDGSIYHEDGP